MKKVTKTVSVEFRLESQDGFSVNIALGSGSIKQSIEIDDIIALKPEVEHPFYFQVEEIKEDEIGEVILKVKYFKGIKVIKRAAIYDASIIPISNSKCNYQAIAVCIVSSEKG